MAQHAQDRAKQRVSENISSIISLFMTFAALVYMYFMGRYLDENHEITSIWFAIPPLALLAGAMWFLIKPAKVEW